MHLLSATWQNLHKVGTLSTTCGGGVSKTPFKSFNLGYHVGDNQDHVSKNRSLLTKYLPKPTVWLNQVHSSDVVIVDEHFDSNKLHNADALYTQLLNQPLAIMTADCLPILLVSDDEKEVAAIHGGWRGLEQGIIKNTLECFSSRYENINAWLGPAIGPTQFEVGAEVFELFQKRSSSFIQAFTPQANGKYLADIYGIARTLLTQQSVKKITGGDYCTVSQSDLFFSYRRDGQTGRMASLIWRK
ncbi:peptidoglycan editing factor PgeF [Pseudoalteromonas distincta]|uniref:peptidoglycan editing factor PgeF n=1 Tax=Pseudoalteromonas distincta TaxID=77608 RepID=UPI0023422842|nr:peptidoglycan editing factor PgeF [Pseudoalteromonas distincta]MDC3213097.1 peptidoglycan editing factor PgeF [Pseudoalteromonas distincta]